MKKSLFIIVSFIIMFSGHSFSQNKKIGAGIILGEPTGFSFKYWLSEKTAIDAGFVWSFVDENAFQIQSDYLIHNFNLIEMPTGKLPFYFGLGGRLKFATDVIFGVRVPLGLDYLFDEAPVDVFFEVVPTLDVIPKTDFTLSAAIGARYFFNYN